ncbi:hypothetical protein Q8F55_006485 [Vanrija albida]|uniref:Glucose-6-phosphate 1-epimerase n=1 Tax=Vanrija albida TaxID=181172 RepID=A0ABR3PXK3_9TREE
MGVEQNDKSIILTHANGATAEIYLFGATVTSWKVNGKENIFLSNKAALDGSAAIRGGIPVVFPIFGPPPSSPPEYAALKQHGFLRTQTWKLDKILLDREEGVSVRLVAPPPPASFGHQDIQVHYVVTLAGHQLVSDLHIRNNGTEDFKFQALLHTYLAVPDASKISLTGIAAGVTYKDKVLGGQEFKAPGGSLVVDRQIDRVYAKIPSQEIQVNDGQDGGYKVRFRGFEDATIWNPTAEAGSKMADMEPGGWDRYVCVEPGFVSEWKTLPAGKEFTGQQVITLV